MLEHLMRHDAGAGVGQPLHALAAFAREGLARLVNADQSPIAGAHSDIRRSEILWAAIAGAGLS